VRLFDAEGRFVECFPPDLLERLLDPGVLPALKQHRPVSLFYSRVGLWTLFYPDETMDFSRTVPLLEVYVPLHEESGPLAGIAQFLIEGHSISAEFARLDRRLAVQALTAFAVGGGILMVALGWAFTRLNHANRLLTERTTSLVRANQELVLAAKTSALGAVAAHLIHGLKNPLAGLQTFVNTGSAAGGPIEDADWHHAVASTRRMQGMINHVISVLHEDQSGTAYTVTAAELEEMVRVRVQSLARERGVQYAAMIRSEFNLPNRIANLVALILVNLCENAVQATPKGKPVTLEMQNLRERLQFTVSDQGPGFPADVPLFMPCRSTKEQGTGVGLALCKQLANHLDATLELAQSTAEGCVFRLSLPVLQSQLTHSRQDGSTQTNIET
jgi:signal transduction histidine kinase